MLRTVAPASGSSHEPARAASQRPRPGQRVIVLRPALGAEHPGERAPGIRPCRPAAPRGRCSDRPASPASRPAAPTGDRSPPPPPGPPPCARTATATSSAAGRSSRWCPSPSPSAIRAPEAFVQPKREGLLALVHHVVEHRHRDRLLGLARREAELAAGARVVRARRRRPVGGRIGNLHRAGCRPAQRHREIDGLVGAFLGPRVRHRHRHRSPHRRRDAVRQRPAVRRAHRPPGCGRPPPALSATVTSASESGSTVTCHRSRRRFTRLADVARPPATATTCSRSRRPFIQPTRSLNAILNVNARLPVMLRRHVHERRRQRRGPGLHRRAGHRRRRRVGQLLARRPPRCRSPPRPSTRGPPAARATPRRRRPARP